MIVVSTISIDLSAIRRNHGLARELEGFSRLELPQITADTAIPVFIIGLPKYGTAEAAFSVDEADDPLLYS